MNPSIYNQFNKGSEWRKWDLHLHTPYTNLNGRSFNATDDEFIQRLKDKQISAVALTNYFSFKEEEYLLQEKLKSQGIAAFLNLELRASYTNKEDQCCDIHIIFSDDVSKAEIDIFLTKLHLNVDGSEKMAIQLEPSELTKATVEFKDLLSVLNDSTLQLKDRHFLGFLSRGHGDGRSSSNFETLYENCDFLLHSSDEQHNLKRDREFWLQNGRPLYQSSDAHNLDSVGEKFSWIKADTTFEGLKQVMYEPEERISLLETKPDYKSQYQVIDSLEMGGSNLWSGKVHFNENLNVIIGGRSTGKSSLLSTIAMKLDSQNVQSSKNYDFIQEGLSSVTINWMDGEQEVNREIEFYPQSYMNTLAFDDVKRNKLIEGIVSKKDEAGELTNYEKFLSAQETMQTKFVSDLFTLNTEIKAKKAQISELGDKVGIEHEIQHLTEQLEQHNSQLTDEVKEKYEAVSKQHSELKDKNREIQTHLVQVSNAKNLKLFNELDLTDKLSHPVFGDDLPIKLNEMQEAFTKEWQDAVQKHHDHLWSELGKIINEKEVVEKSEVYKKSQEYLESNSALKEIKEKSELEQDKLTKIQGEEKVLESLENSLETTIETLCVSHLAYKTHSESLSQKLHFDQSNLEVTVKCCFDSEKMEEILSEQLNKTKSRDIISTFCEIYDKEPKRTVRDLVQIALNDQLHFKGVHNNKTLLNQVLCSNPYRKDYELTYQNDSFDSMSQGKQAFVILKLLLEFNDKTCPVLIDQPEDSLDNRAIYNELVEYLKQKKKERQIILVTHNPNVVVSADAEQVIVANQHDPKAKNNLGKKFEYVAGGIEHSMPKNPNVDEILFSQGIREHICEILEGGEDAFKKREQKYQLSN
ncbi:TrlF family AAA-like ATPase [Vibrio sp. 10N.247.311.26]|uniref:TrlF family AAA-like ATPase n=1 Tax=Vibrio sp. 10N.247.311.26 TaxID=3229995 RepID=UPI00354DB4BD